MNLFCFIFGHSFSVIPYRVGDIVSSIRGNEAQGKKIIMVCKKCGKSYESKVEKI